MPSSKPSKLPETKNSELTKDQEECELEDAIFGEFKMPCFEFQKPDIPDCPDTVNELIM